MPTTPRRLRAALPAAVVSLGLLLAACGASDASRSDVQDELEESGLTAEQAECVTDSLFEDLDQGQINTLYESDTEEEAGEEAVAALTAATTECVTAEAGG